MKIKLPYPTLLPTLGYFRVVTFSNYPTLPSNYPKKNRVVTKICDKKHILTTLPYPPLLRGRVVG